MKIKELRIKYNFNMKEFAEFLNIPYRTVQNWEYGVRECPRYVVELIEFRLNAEFPPSHP